MYPSVANCPSVQTKVNAGETVTVICQQPGQTVGGNPYWVLVNTTNGSSPHLTPTTSSLTGGHHMRRTSAVIGTAAATLAFLAPAGMAAAAPAEPSYTVVPYENG
ncbi:hypothetical protein OG601_44485 [Streptomyces sp. NBC_01239]|uniref:hypothetical protein n=1 Tax=Streptomyces sp. NBC_01239 TaxID=2903792 RepID=UPI00225956C5|nr:hypothetical protein [Streptomyces sp. NBC_01239]MCX4817657.1 hypothetical protein [Streptomyces sp. NBC_01239]